MTHKKTKAGVIAVTGSLVLLAVWKTDEKFNKSKGGAWFIDELIQFKTVNTEVAKKWLRRTPLVEQPEDADKQIDEVVEEGIERGLLRRIKRIRSRQPPAPPA